MCGRLVSSAKSWLSHSGVDRTVADRCRSARPKASRRSRRSKPAARYLEHLRDAWDARCRTRRSPSQQVLVTVPASFDAVARELTLEAAQAGRLRQHHAARRAAGRLLRLDRAPSRLARARAAGRPDPGGRYRRRHHRLHADRGDEEQGELALERVAVGEHILLGGDNIDLALARHGGSAAGGEGHAHRQRCSCRRCGTTAASPRRSCCDPESKAQEQPVTILGKGTGLVGGTIKATLLRADIERVLGDGFLPAVASNDMPAAQRRVGLQETRTAVRGRRRRSPGTWRASCASRRRRQHGGAPRPERTGLSHARAVQWRRAAMRRSCASAFCRRLNSWLEAERLPPVKPLSGEDLMHAVARGAAYYGLRAQRQRRAHSRRRPAHLLRRHRERHARRSPDSRLRSRRSRWCRSAWKKAPTRPSPAASSAWSSASRRSSASSPRPSRKNDTGPAI